MRFLRVALVLLFALPGTAYAAGMSVVARELPLRATRPEAAPHRFDLVGFHWQGSGTVLFRTRAADGAWTRWRTAAAEEEDGPDAGSAEARRGRGWHVGSPYWVGASDRVQYRSSGHVTRLRAYFVRPGRSAARVPAATYLAGSPAITTRAAWGANERIRRGTPTYAPTLRFAIVHHTAGSNNYGPGQSASIVRAIEAYHVLGNGWNDIGYNFLVDRYGHVFEGRYGGADRPVVGAHAMGFNYESVGIALIGTYTHASITPPQRRALVRLLAWRLDVAHVDPLSHVRAVSTGNPEYSAGTPVVLRAISGHRDTGPTECPGSSAYAELPGIARAVAATGLPKIYSPAVRGGLGGQVRFTARLSAPRAWTVSVTDALGRPVAAGSGTGAFVDWTWDASAIVSGRYAYTISAGPAARPVTGTLGGPVPQLGVHDVSVDPGIVTPNGDGQGDVARVTYVLGAPGNVTATLVDAAGTPVATLSSGFHGSGRQSFTWTAPDVADGRYRIVVTAVNAAGVTASGEVQLVVDRTLGGLTVSPPAISPNGDGRSDVATLSFTLAAAADVRVAILHAGKIVQSLFAGHLQPGPQRVRWAGGGLSDARYRAVVTARDPLAAVTQAVGVTLDTKPPTLRVVSLQPLVFSIDEPATVTVDVDGVRITKSVGRGRFRVEHAGAVRTLVATAVDVAGNASKPVRRP